MISPVDVVVTVSAAAVIVVLIVGNKKGAVGIVKVVAREPEVFVVRGALLGVYVVFLLIIIRKTNTIVFI